MTRAGLSKSEGGFAEGRYAAASLLDVSESKDKKGRNYYQYELLVRSADGDEGGRHQLVKSTVGSDGNLYIIKCQARTPRRRCTRCAVAVLATGLGAACSAVHRCFVCARECLCGRGQLPARAPLQVLNSSCTRAGHLLHDPIICIFECGRS